MLRCCGSNAASIARALEGSGYRRGSDSLPRIHGKYLRSDDESDEDNRRHRRKKKPSRKKKNKKKRRRYESSSEESDSRSSSSSSSSSSEEYKKKKRTKKNKKKASKKKRRQYADEDVPVAPENATNNPHGRYSNNGSNLQDQLTQHNNENGDFVENGDSDDHDH